jgi:predicted dehydrogenase
MMKIGICGVGSFSEAFIPLFKAHPLVSEVVLADLLPERLEHVAAKYGIRRTAASHDELCASDVDAIAIFAQRHLHGPLTIQALKAGKHVYCAVPIASTLEEMAEVVKVVEETRLVYMNGETCYYYPHTIYCRDRYKKGDFGHFVYGEAAYLHDMSHGFYQAFQHSGGADWKKVAGFPPMFYPTHSTSMIVSVTGARLTQVSCLGYRDRHEDGIFTEEGNLWGNPYSNQTALLRSSDGGMVRINEFRRVGWWGKSSSNPVSIFGTKGSFEESSGGQYWTELAHNKIVDLSELLHCARNHIPKEDEHLHEVLQKDFNSLFSPIHPVHRLPASFKGLRNGHLGSHQFLVDDFVKAAFTGKLPPVNVWEAAKYCAPGLVAHESALRDGVSMDIPDFGEPPEGWELLDPDQPVQESLGKHN